MALILLVAESASAHHPTLVNYDPAKTGTVTGKVAKVQWTNPHVVIALEVIGSDGSSERWFIEGYPPNTLQKRLKQDSLREGTQITVSGWHARDQGLKIFCGSEVTFEDGSKRQFGTAHAFYQRYKDKVYSISLYFFHGDDAAASDATQQVFLKLMTGIGQFKDDCEFSTWLYRMVVNTCLDGTKAAKRREPLADAAKLARIAAPQSAEEDRARAEVAGKVQIALSSLPPKLRLPVLLRYL